MDIAQLAEDEQREVLRDLGITERGSREVYSGRYQLLDLISFLTSGEDECRAWSIRRGKSAHRPQARFT